MFNLRALRGAPAPPRFTPDLDGDGPARLLSEFLACLDGEGDRRMVVRRTAALAALFGNLSPAGRERFARTLAALDDMQGEAGFAYYSALEFSEYVGRTGGRRTLADAFQPPRRRLLALLRDAPDGASVLEALKLAEPAIADDVDAALGG